MATRAEIAIYQNYTPRNKRPAFIIIKSHNGNPEAIIPLIVPILKAMGDNVFVGSCAAWLVHSLIEVCIKQNIENKAAGELPDMPENGRDFAGVWLADGREFGCSDSDYTYIIYKNTLEIRHSRTSEVIETIKFADWKEEKITRKNVLQFRPKN